MRTQDRPSATAFRGDVQGMRAVAVLVVVLGHAGVPFLPGGFVGVDVFFVVSGFLITRLVLDGVRRDDGFSPLRFYARRARRILPAATVVLAVTVLASALYLSFLDVLRIAEDAAWAVFFAANFRFLEQNVDYYAADQAPSPLQHYWSLAVEEQFYVLFPLLVLLAVLLAKPLRRTTLRRPAVILGLLVGALGFASLMYAVVLTTLDPEGAYFSSPARAWEIAAGCLLACLLDGRRAGSRRRLAEVLGWGGLVAVVVAVVVYDGTVAFPGIAALLPVLGTVALLTAGEDPVDPPLVTRLLATRPLQLVGDWSYSIYLWHWPLLVIPATRLDRPLTGTEALVAVALTVQLAYLTHRFVEQPFRTGQVWRRRPARGLLLYPVSLAVVLGVAFGSHSWATYLGSERGDNPPIRTQDVGIDGDTVVDQVRASVIAAREGRPIPSDLTPDLLDLENEVADVGDCNYNEDPPEDWELCERGDPDGERTLVVTGDSHARAWIPAFERIARSAGYRAYYLVKGRCSAAFVLPAYPRAAEPFPECEDFHDWVGDQLEEIDPDVMIVSTATPSNGVYVGEERITDDGEVERLVEAGFDEMFQTYRPLVERLVLLVDVPQLSVAPGPCLADRGASLDDCTPPPSETSLRMRDISVGSALRSDVESVDPSRWLCAEGLCPTVIGSTITYRDQGHITTTRAEELWLALGLDLGLLEVSGTDD